MQETELSVEEKHRLYEKLMEMIFGEREDLSLPLCYSYIIEGEERISLEEGVKRVLETLSDLSTRRFFSHRTKNQWTKENQIKLLNLRFGLEDGKARKLEEISREFEVGRERIRQVQNRIFRMLRHPNRSKFLRAFLIPNPEEIQELRAETQRVREENERLWAEREFIQKFGLSQENIDIDLSRRALLAMLEKAASLYLGTTQNLVTRAYNALLQDGINSLSQVRALMNIDEGKIRRLRNLGEKSFWLIREALEIAEKENNELGAP